MTLNDALSFKTYKIKAVGGVYDERRRLLDIGFTPGSSVSLLTRAPLGDTVLVVLRNFTVALRNDAAELIEVEDKA